MYFFNVPFLSCLTLQQGEKGVEREKGNKGSLSSSHSVFPYHYAANTKYFMQQ